MPRNKAVLPCAFILLVTLTIVPLVFGISGCSGGSRRRYPTSQDSPTTSDYKTARCTDGSYTNSKQPEIFCAARGGIDQRYDRPY